MYYEKRKNNFYGTALILIFLMIIIFILINIIQKIETNSFENKENAELTGTDTIMNDFNLQDLAKNAGYSVVRCFKIK